MSVWSADARTCSLGVPEMCTGAVNGSERYARRFGWVASGLPTMVACDWGVLSSNDSGAGLRDGTSDRSPPGWKYTSVAVLPGTGQSACVSHTSAERSMSTIGSSMMPFGTPCSQKSNQRCRVDTQTSRRTSNGSTWPSCDSHSLRGMFCSARAYQYLLKWSGRTLSSFRPW